ncbi:MAG: glycosyltransferase involved in cell wall biosynthesis [Sphingobacteriales bacterium]|jgi:glycosyltransferase involved in cell wall biosynthesis
MKVLIICNKAPYPKKDGGCVAMANLIEGLAKKGIQLHVFVLETFKHSFMRSAIPVELREKHTWESCFIDTKIHPVDAFTSIMNRESYNLNRFFSADVDRRIVELLSKETFDVIHLESLYSCAYIATIRRSCESKLVLRSHNLEFEIWERLAQKTKNPIKRLYLNYLSKQLRKEEISISKSVNGVASISSSDLGFYTKNSINAELIPFGLDLENEHVQRNHKQQFFHLGAMDWIPNIKAMNGFISNAWIPFVEKHPTAQLHLAGRKCFEYSPPTNHPSIINHGEVKKARDFMAENGIMVVPLFAGSGIRIKIIEGMSLGVPIITTPIGIQSIEHLEGESVLITKNWEGWLNAMETLWLDPDKAKAIGIMGREKACANHSIERASEALINFYENILEG